jgi:hypothetical protein
LNHPDDEAVIRYISEKCSPQEQLEMDTHFSECPSCRERAGTILFIRENFDTLWESWTAAEHGRVHQQIALARALKQAAKIKPTLAEEIKRWFEQLGAGLCISAAVLLDRTKKIALLASTVLPAELKSELRPAFVGIGSPKEQAKVNEHLKKGSELLSQNKAEQAVNEMLQVVKIDARSSLVSTLNITRRDSRLLEVRVDSKSRTVLIMFWPIEGEGHPRLVILAPKEGEPMVSEFKLVEGADYFLAEFTGLPDGLFTLFIGPNV